MPIPLRISSSQWAHGKTFSRPRAGETLQGKGSQQHSQSTQFRWLLELCPHSRAQNLCLAWWCWPSDSPPHGDQSSEALLTIMAPQHPPQASKCLTYAPKVPSEPPLSAHSHPQLLMTYTLHKYQRAAFCLPSDSKAALARANQQMSLLSMSLGWAFCNEV